MGNSSSSSSSSGSTASKSSSNQKSTTAESKSDYNYVAQDALSDVEKEKFVKEMTESLTQQNEKLKKLTDKMEQEQKNGGVTPDSWFTAMTALVKSTQDANTLLLTEIEAPIQQSEAAYTHFRNLVNSKALKQYPERVKGAMTVYHNYWSLLTTTSSKLTKIMVKVDRVVESIEDYYAEKECSENNIASSESIGDCTKYLNQWLLETQGIEELANEWNRLSEEAEKEEVAWKQIELQSKRRWKNVAKGICCVVGVAAVCGALCFAAGPIGVIAVGAVGMTCLELTTAAAVGVLGFSLCSGGAYTAYKAYKNAENARKRCEDVSKKIVYISSTMSQIAASAKEIGKILNQLSETFEQINSVTEKVNDVNKKIQETSHDGRKKVLMNRIDQSFAKILPSMTKFNEKCKECCEVICDSKEKIIAKYKSAN